MFVFVWLNLKKTTKHWLYHRCNDVLELVETTRHFRLLADAAEIGGAGSMSLDALVKEIHVKYTQAMKEFFAVVDNVLSIDGTQNFERAFFRFRTVVKVGLTKKCLVLKQKTILKIIPDFWNQSHTTVPISIN